MNFKCSRVTARTVLMHIFLQATLLTIGLYYFCFNSVSKANLTGVLVSPNIKSPNGSAFNKKLTYRCSIGELGNKMFHYAVVYGLARLNNRQGYIQKCNTITCRFSENDCKLAPLDDIFNLSLPVGHDLPENEVRGHEIRFHMRYPEDYSISTDANILVGEKYPNSVTYFLHVREEVRREFRFRKKYFDYAQSVLTRARGSRQNVTLVGVHVRRDIYLEHLSLYGKSAAPREFFLYAMEYFRRTMNDVLFVVLSDDLNWCRQNIAGEDIHVVEKMGSPAEDLAVLSSCQHSIFDYGTYGLWGAFLAGGRAMYYIDGITDPTINDSIYAQKMYPPEWIGVSNDMFKIFCPK